MKELAVQRRIIAKEQLRNLKLMTGLHVISDMPKGWQDPYAETIHQ